MKSPPDEVLEKAIGRQLARRRRHRPSGPAGLLLVGGTVGLLFVVPLLIGAYLGRWLDSLFPGYSVRWTISLIVLGVVAGAVAVFRFLKTFQS